MKVTRRDALRTAGLSAAALALDFAGWDSVFAQRPRNGRIGLGLCIGLNFVDPAHYNNWEGELTGCVPDADDMSSLLRSRNFRVRTLWDRQAAADHGRVDDVARVERVANLIRRAASGLRDGDIFVVTCSSHGSWLQDSNADESDRRDETWCLYDGQMLDDERAALWNEFDPGVQIVVISDTCHSGTTARVADYANSMIRDISNRSRPRRAGVSREAVVNAAEQEMTRRLEALDRRVRGEAAPAGPSPIRQMPDDVRRNLHLDTEYMSVYNKVQQGIPRSIASAQNIKPRVLSIGSCQDVQTAGDGPTNGLFTGVLLDVWQNGFAGSYLDLFAAIKANMPYYQTPNLDRFGNGASFDDAEAFRL